MFKNVYTVVRRKGGGGDNMTRGRAYLKPKKGEWIESTQLLYDMGFEFPYGNGLKLISGFLRKQLESKKKLDTWLKFWMTFHRRKGFKSFILYDQRSSVCGWV